MTINTEMSSLILLYNYTPVRLSLGGQSRSDENLPVVLDIFLVHPYLLVLIFIEVALARLSILVCLYRGRGGGDRRGGRGGSDGRSGR